MDTKIAYRYEKNLDGTKGSLRAYHEKLLPPEEELVLARKQTIIRRAMNSVKKTGNV